MKTGQYSYEDFALLPSFSFLLSGYEVFKSNRSRRSTLILRFYHWACVCSHVCCVFFMLRRIIEWETINGNILLILRYCTLVTYVVNSDTKYGTALQKNAIQSLNSKLAALFPASENERVSHRVNDYYWSRPLLILTMTYFLSSTLVVIGPVLQSALMYLTEKHFPYMHCYPYYIFNPEQDPLWHYFAIYVLEWLHSTHMVIANMSTDLLLVNFEVQVCMHFDYMARSLQNYEPHHTHDEADLKYISQLVEKHNLLMDLQEEINGIFGGSLLLSLLTTAGVLCTVAVYTQMQGLNLEGITYIAFMMTACSQLFLVCHFGERVSTLSTEVAQAAFGHNWHNASPAYKKSLLMIITRAQRPAELSAMGYLSVSLDTFKQVMTVTYRVFALIRTMIE